MQKLILSTLIAVILLSACGKKEAESLCATKVRKEFMDSNMKATVEDGCIVKYADANSYKISGSVDFTISGDTTVMKSILLTKGELVSRHGRFVFKGTDESMKIRLVEGEGSIIYSGKTTPLILNNVVEVGSK
jgi:hypothetical protein